MIKYKLFKALPLIFLIFFMTNLSGQSSLPDPVKTKINELKNLTEKFKTEGNKREESKYLNQIAYIYWENNHSKEAISYFNRSLELNIDLGNKNAVRNIYSNLGFICSEQSDYTNALENFEESLKITRQQKNKQDIASALQNTAQVKYELRQYPEAIKDLEEASSLALEENNMKLLQSCYLQLAENYEKIGDPKSSKDYYEKSAALLSKLQKKQLEDVEAQKKDAETLMKNAEINASLKARQLESTLDTLNVIKESIREIQLKSELIEKENMLKDLAIKEEKARNKANRLTLIYLITGLILLFSVLILYFVQFEHKKKANKLLKEQNLEIEKQRDLANKQKQKITDSIQYAQRIQTALLPPENLLKEYLQDYFIFFKPRDIVSGDFYWVTQKENMLVLAAADCTGHGVPGAFMSMLGVAYLNEIVNKIAINRHIRSMQANEILMELRLQVINSLHQSGDRHEQKDGMDIALCIIDFEEKKMQFSGAHCPLFFVRNGELMIYQGDKMPVSYHKNKDIPFTLHTIDLRRGDTFYIFSDGFIDQFGGNEGMKFQSNNFKELLSRIQDKPMQEQKNILSKSFEDWKGNHDQTDDVMVIGFKFTGRRKIGISDDRFIWEDRQILIAEDTDVNFLFLVEALRQTKSKITRVKNGREAVEYCKAFPVDLVLMDINMPEMNGIEATRIIKNFRKDIPVIIQTALNMGDEEDESMKAGADDYISKPIDLKSFLNKLEKYLG